MTTQQEDDECFETLFLEEVLTALKSVTPEMCNLAEPDWQVPYPDDVVGVANNRVRKLLYLAKVAAQEMYEHLATLMLSPHEERDQLRGIINLAEQRHTGLMNLLMAEVNLHFPQLEGGDFRIGKDWFVARFCEDGE